VEEQTQALFNAALQLPEDERTSLVLRLLETLPNPNVMSEEPSELEGELERRCADRTGAIPWTDLRSETSRDG
jgi:hypothetical protein